jgi:hypothetical protein
LHKVIRGVEALSFEIDNCLTTDEESAYYEEDNHRRVAKLAKKIDSAQEQIRLCDVSVISNRNMVNVTENYKKGGNPA